MREILFRGKRIDNGEWVYGDLIHLENKFYISYYYESALTTFINETFEYDGISIIGAAPFIEVDPSTIGQYTGLTDKNGKKIFEGDIIRANHDGAVGAIRFGEYMSPSDPGNTRHIGYYVDWQGKDKDFLRADLGYWASRRDVEVVGNIHDNPELLEDKP